MLRGHQNGFHHRRLFDEREHTRQLLFFGKMSQTPIPQIVLYHHGDQEIALDGPVGDHDELVPVVCGS